MDRILSGASNQDQSGPTSADSEGVLCIPQSWSLDNRLFDVKSKTLVVREGLSRCRDAASVLNNRCQLGFVTMGTSPIQQRNKLISTPTKHRALEAHLLMCWTVLF